MTLQIKEKDTVIITGQTLEKGGKISYHRALAAVVAVGKYDAFVVLQNGSSFNKNPFRVSLENCQKVENIKKTCPAQIKEPKLGNLVLSIETTYSGTKKNIGVVKKIISIPGDPIRVEIEHSTKKIIVPYDSLIILEN